MADIPDTEYITVKRDENGAVGFFVGGEPATHYRGMIICDIDYVKDTFAIMQKKNPNITELHVLSSETSGGYAMVGNPSPEHGSNAWCRVKYKGGQFGGWVFEKAYSSATNCVHNCASDCAYHVRVDATFRCVLLGTYIPNTKYITINKDGVFVGGKPATTYRGVNIYDIDYVKDIFAWIRRENPNITELHVLSSKTSGEFATVGDPSPEHGRYAWCRVKNKDGQFGGWVCDHAGTSATYCAAYCANICALKVWEDVAFRRAVLDAAVDRQTTVALKQKIVVEKITQNTK